MIGAYRSSPAHSARSLLASLGMINQQRQRRNKPGRLRSATPSPRHQAAVAGGDRRGQGEAGEAGRQGKAPRPRVVDRRRRQWLEALSVPRWSRNIAGCMRAWRSHSWVRVLVDSLPTSSRCSFRQQSDRFIGPIRCRCFASALSRWVWPESSSSAPATTRPNDESSCSTRNSRKGTRSLRRRGSLISPASRRLRHPCRSGPLRFAAISIRLPELRRVFMSDAGLRVVAYGPEDTRTYAEEMERRLTRLNGIIMKLD